jgi:hypothetical protein
MSHAPIDATGAPKRFRNQFGNSRTGISVTESIGSWLREAASRTAASLGPV